MATVRDIYEFIDSFAPFCTQMSFDNSGLLVGDEKAQVTRALLTLDISGEAVREAEKLGCELVISHHPVIFYPLRSVMTGTPVYALVKAGISAICAHTNLDIAEGGVNTCLADRLLLTETQTVEGCEVGLLGKTDKTYTPEGFARFVKERLGCGSVELAGGGNEIKNAAVLSGAGGGDIEKMLAAGADAVVTGEVKHNVFVDMCGVGKTLIAAGHYHTEAVVLEPLARKLREAFPDTQFILTQTGSPSKAIY